MELFSSNLPDNRTDHIQRDITDQLTSLESRDPMDGEKS